MSPENEQIRKDAITRLANADSFVCVTITEDKLDFMSVTNPERLGMMLLSIMRSNPAFANSVNLAALGYAREHLYAPTQENQQ